MSVRPFSKDLYISAQMEILEIIATITGILAVVFQAKEKIYAWPFGIISVAIASYIFFNSKLYSDFGLHIIYIFLNIYGWVMWLQKESDKQVRATSLLSQKGILLSILITLAGSFILGYVMQNYTDADLPYFDAFTTSGSLVAQFLLAKKYLQNWFLWFVVDIVALPVYLYKGLYYFAFLFFIYLLLCVYGYFSWKKQMNIELAQA